MVYIAFGIAIYVIVTAFFKASGRFTAQLAAIRGLLVEIRDLLSSIEDRSESLSDVGTHVDEIADLASTYKKYNTFPLGPLGRPLIGSESEYNKRPG